MPDQLWKLTPAELKAIVDAKHEDRKNNWIVYDNMNSLLCTIVAACAGNKDAKPEHFQTILRTDPEEDISDMPEKGDSPEMIMKKLEMITLSLGGKPRGA